MIEAEIDEAAFVAYAKFLPSVGKAVRLLLLLIVVWAFMCCCYLILRVFNSTADTFNDGCRLLMLTLEKVAGTATWLPLVAVSSQLPSWLGLPLSSSFASWFPTAFPPPPSSSSSPSPSSFPFPSPDPPSSEVGLTSTSNGSMPSFGLQEILSLLSTPGALSAFLWAVQKMRH